MNDSPTTLAAVLPDSLVSPLRHPLVLMIAVVVRAVLYSNFFRFLVAFSVVYASFIIGWRRGSVVRASVFGWRTFPDLCLIYG